MTCVDQTKLTPNAPICLPPTPKGVSVEINMKLASAKAGAVLSPSDMNWFYQRVRNKGAWDFKQIDRKYEAFGNFHYGAVGFAMGVPEQVLLRAAGWASRRADHQGDGGEFPFPGNWYTSPPFGDDPKDQIHIRNGIEYAKRKGY